MSRADIDIEIEEHGAMPLIVPVTEAARLLRCIGGVAVEARHAPAILDTALDEGLTVSGRSRAAQSG